MKALSDLGPLAFCAVCVGLAAPLLFAASLPPAWTLGALVALLVALGARAWASPIGQIRNPRFLPRTVVGWANLTSLLLLPLGLWATPDRATSWPVACKVVAGLALFYGVAGLARTRWMFGLPWALLLTAAGLALLVLVGTRWTGYVKVPWFPRGLYDLLPRVQLPVGADQINANIGGAAMALLIPPVAALALWGVNRWLRLAAGLATAAALGVLLLTQARLAWVAEALVLLALPIIHARRWKLVLLGTAGLAVLGAMGVALVLSTGSAGPLAQALGIQVSTLRTVGGRVGIWASAFAVVRDFPLTGVGPGMFERVATVRYPPPELGFNHAHNVLLQTAADFGVGGAIAHLALLTGLAAGLIAGQRSAAYGTLAALQTGLFGSLMAYGFLGMMDCPIISPYIYAISFALFGAMAAVGSRRADVEASRHEPKAG